MCGRITQKSNPHRLGLGLVTTTLTEPLIAPPRYNGAPGQLHFVIREHPETGERTLDPLFWGLVPHWVRDEKGGRKPINARAETIASLPSFRDAFQRRRCLLPVDSYFEWRTTREERARQPFAIALGDGDAPFALAAIWENWRRPGTDEWLRSFAVITTQANEFLATIHDRMPVILAREDYARWLDPAQGGPHDLLRSFPPATMTAWPISLRVNKPVNDDAEILAEIAG